jgi:hypothetical protein
VRIVHVRDLARAAAQVRGLNLYPTRGGVTHFGQVHVNRQGAGGGYWVWGLFWLIDYENRSPSILVILKATVNAQ